MTTMNSYRDIARSVLEDIHKIATQVDVPVEKVFAMKIASWEQEVERERELLAQRTQVSAEREAAAAALPEALAPFKASGTWPRARDIIGKLGLPPTKSHIGWVNWKLRQLSYQPAQPSAQPAE